MQSRVLSHEENADVEAALARLRALRDAHCRPGESVKACLKRLLLKNHPDKEASTEARAEASAEASEGPALARTACNLETKEACGRVGRTSESLDIKEVLARWNDYRIITKCRAEPEIFIGAPPSPSVRPPLLGHAEAERRSSPWCPETRSFGADFSRPPSCNSHAWSANSFSREYCEYYSAGATDGGGGGGGGDDEEKGGFADETRGHRLVALFAVMVLDFFFAARTFASYLHERMAIVARVARVATSGRWSSACSARARAGSGVGRNRTATPPPRRTRRCASTPTP